MGRGRPTKCKIKEVEFVQYMLDNLVDEKGDKVSCRKVWSDVEFIKWSGFNHESANDGEYKPISTGSIRYYQTVKKYWIPVLSEKYGKKMCLNEETLFMYHKEVSGKISAETTFNEFSREKNRGYSHKINKNNKKRKTSLNILNDISRELGAMISYANYGGSMDDYREYLMIRYGDNAYDRAHESVVGRYGD